MIKVEHLNKYYNKGKSNEIHVINDVCLELPTTGLVSFLGQSGSGKTTLLNVIGGLDKAAGSIRYDDTEIKNYHMRKIDRLRSRDIGYVFQNYHLILEETVYNNLAIALNMIGIFDKEEIDKRIEYCLKAVGLYKYRKKQAFALSGGQQQRVSIARALIKKSKVIIADEPTGNLDSENTYEVMNILKKISENTLVLLVTHNEEIANFYSNQVIRIQDGSIARVYSPEGNQTLSKVNSKKIYLKDLHKAEEETSFGTIEYYCEDELPEALNLKVVFKNGNIYVEASKALKLTQENGIQFLDEHYEEITKDTLSELTYDNTWFKETGKRKGIFRKLWESLKQSVNSLRITSRRVKFMFIAMFFIGLLFAVCTIGFTNFIYVDESRIYADGDFYQFYSDYTLSAPASSNYVRLGIRSGYFGDAVCPVSAEIELFHKVNYEETINYSFSSTLVDYRENSTHKILVGRAPQSNEILLSRRHAKILIDKYNYIFDSYESLIGLDVGPLFRDGTKNYTICGVIDIDSNISYFSESDYMSRLVRPTSSVANTSHTFRSYETEHKYNTYQILAGRDLNEEDNGTNNILLPQSYPKAEEWLNQPISLNGETFTAVGIYASDYFTGAMDYIIHNSKYPFSLTGTRKYYKNEEYRLLEGRTPENYSELMVSVYSSYSIGSVLYDGFQTPRTVVGLYTGEDSVAATTYLEGRDYFIFNDTSSDEVWFKVLDLDSYKQNNANNFIRICTTYQAQISSIRAESQSSLISFGIFAGVLLFTLAVFIYFFMRSRMINDIYTIGVYRSLGASKGSIQWKYFCNIFVLTTVTTFIGYILTLIIYTTIANAMTDMTGMQIIRTSWWMNTVGGVVLYLLTLVFGLLPITSLMRKTPAEIIAKYDI